jgi:hypothetical protein
MRKIDGSAFYRAAAWLKHAETIGQTLKKKSPDSEIWDQSVFDSSQDDANSIAQAVNSMRKELELGPVFS